MKDSKGGKTEKIVKAPKAKDEKAAKVAKGIKAPKMRWKLANRTNLMSRTRSETMDSTLKGLKTQRSGHISNQF